jgi:hypothetical protein
MRTSSKAGLFSNSTQAQLFEMSAANGLDCSFNDFDINCGVLCIDLQKSDLGGYIPNALMNFMFDLTVTVQRADGATSLSAGLDCRSGAFGAAHSNNFILYVVSEMGGSLVCNGDKVFLDQGREMSEIIQAIGQGYSDVDVSLLQGKGFMKSLGRIFRKGKKFINQAAHVVNPLLDVAAQVDPRFERAAQIGHTAQQLTGGKMVKRSLKGGMTKLY